jgi:3-deoxy-D-manno-oct-2-ulosonic acid (Kdo) hydroxylase
VTPLVELQPRADCRSPEIRELALETIESGGIVYLPGPTFELTEREQRLVADSSVTLPTRKERESRNGRPTVIFDPARAKILRARIKGPQRHELEAMMVRFGRWAENLVAELLPSYARGLTRDRITFRPCERANPQGLHVDSSYGRPTEGRGMLRVFSNINPEGRERVWQVGEQFEALARRYLPTAHIKPPSAASWILGRLGVTNGRRTAYDELMADIRGQVKSDEAYQSIAPRRIVRFAQGSAWIVITDLVLHGALSGQYSLDQTFFLPAQRMREPGRSSLRTLERLVGRSLA